MKLTDFLTNEFDDNVVCYNREDLCCDVDDYCNDENKLSNDSFTKVSDNICTQNNDKDLKGIIIATRRVLSLNIFKKYKTSEK